MMNLLSVKCVICGHRFEVKPTAEMPMCPKCLGPVTVQKAKAKKR
jgi:endogenous inhibitor of DNA gyrase (YacG/DUF329 family)